MEGGRGLEFIEVGEALCSTYTVDEEERLLLIVTEIRTIVSE